MSGQLSPEAQEDYSALLDALIPFAEEMLKKHGEFYPFGAAVDNAGEVSAHAGSDGTETPSPEALVTMLVGAFQAEARDGKIRAAGICTNGRIAVGNKETDAIIVRMEHATGDAKKACVPYKKGLFGGYRLGDLVAGLDEGRIFIAK